MCTEKHYVITGLELNDQHGHNDPACMFIYNYMFKYNRTWVLSDSDLPCKHHCQFTWTRQKNCNFTKLAYWELFGDNLLIFIQQWQFGISMKDLYEAICIQIYLLHRINVELLINYNGKLNYDIAYILNSLPKLLFQLVCHPSWSSIKGCVCQSGWDFNVLMCM